MIVRGLRELIIAADASGRNAKRYVRGELRNAARFVADDARDRFAGYSEKTAAGFRPIVRRTGVISVEQRLRKTTGRRPDWGTTQMRDALIPALRDEGPRFREQIVKVADRLAAELNAGGLR